MGETGCRDDIWLKGCHGPVAPSGSDICFCLQNPFFPVLIGQMSVYEFVVEGLPYFQPSVADNRSSESTARIVIKKHAVVVSQKMKNGTFEVEEAVRG